MAPKCRISFSLICLFGVAVGIAIVAVEILTVSAPDWMLVKSANVYFKFGIFDSSKTIGNTIVASTHRASIVCMQSMSVIAIIMSTCATITLFISALQVRSFKRSPLFYFILGLVFFALSGITLLIGLSYFSHDWLKHYRIFFTGQEPYSTFSYGYSYFLSWLCFVLCLVVSLYLVLGYYFVKDRSQAEYDNRIAETERLVAEAKADAVEEVVETAHAVDEATTSR